MLETIQRENRLFAVDCLRYSGLQDWQPLRTHWTTVAYVRFLLARRVEPRNSNALTGSTTATSGLHQTLGRVVHSRYLPSYLC